MVYSRSRFARNIFLMENIQFRSSQLTPSVGTLCVILAERKRNQQINIKNEKNNNFNFNSFFN